MRRSTQVETVRGFVVLDFNQFFVSELIVAKLDQKNRRIEFDSAAARDFQPEDIPAMIQTFEQWLEVTESTADCVKELITKAKAENREYAEQKQIKTAKASDHKENLFQKLIICSFSWHPS